MARDSWWLSLACSCLCLITIGPLANQPVDACSVFTAHDDQTVLVGNNEDYFPGDGTLLWFVPPANGAYGAVFWGYDSNHFSQGGLNDQGLFFDGLATASLKMTKDTGTKPFVLNTLEQVLLTSATVDEALAALEQYSLGAVLEKGQLIFVDRTGASAILEGDAVVRPEGAYQIATNFLHTRPDLGGWPCERYQVLEQMITQGLQLTPSYFREMAKAAQPPAGGAVSTRYTTVADLKKLQLHVYVEGDYDTRIVLDLAAELSKGSRDVTFDALHAEAARPDAGPVDPASKDAEPSPDQGAPDAGPPEPADASPAPSLVDSDDGCALLHGAGSGPAGPVLLLLAVCLLVGRSARRDTNR